MDNYVINELATSNESNYNLLKSVEELLELAEVLQKRVLKAKSEKNPTDEMIVDEIGEVIIRIEVLKRIFGEDRVKDRVDAKLKKFRDYLEKEMYIGTI